MCFFLRRLFCRILLFVIIVGLYNLLNQRMTHYIVAGQVAETDIIDLSKHLHGYIQTGYRSARQILLGLVTGNDDLGAKPIRVRNIFIWAGVVFCASSRMM